MTAPAQSALTESERRLSQQQIPHADQDPSMLQETDPHFTSVMSSSFQLLSKYASVGL